MPARRVQVTFFADLVCPFCFVAAAPYGRLRADGEIDLRVVPFEIHPETPREGVPLASFGAPKVEALYREVRWMGQAQGVDRIAVPERLPNTRLALEALEAARASGGDARALDFAGRAFAAYFQEGRDLGSEDVLRDLLARCGVARDAQDACLYGRKQGPAVDAARREAEDALVTAVPAARVGEFPVVGARPYNELRRLVERAAAGRP
jgi:predicted DsbA family dithiol-disulfide isomerase